MPFNEDGSRKAAYLKKSGFKMKYNNSSFPFNINPNKDDEEEDDENEE